MSSLVSERPFDLRLGDYFGEHGLIVLGDWLGLNRVKWMNW